MLISAGKNSNTLTNQMVSATYSQLIACIAIESDASFLSSLYKSLSDTLRVLGGPSSLPPHLHTSLFDATQRQLASMAERRKRRATKLNGYGNGDSGDEGDMDGGEREELALVEEMEDFALEDVGRLMEMFEGFGGEIGQGVQGILVMVGSVRDLGLGLGAWDSEDESVDGGM